MSEKKQTVIVVGHGSKSADARVEFLKTVDVVRASSKFSDVRAAFMELSEPSIEETFEQAVEEGFTDFLVVPYFLFSGNHIKHDIPLIIELQRARFPNIKIKFGKPIGFEPALAEILIKRANDLQNA